VRFVAGLYHAGPANSKGTFNPDRRASLCHAAALRRCRGRDHESLLQESALRAHVEDGPDLLVEAVHPAAVSRIGLPGRRQAGPMGEEFKRCRCRWISEFVSGKMRAVEIAPDEEGLLAGLLSRKSVTLPAAPSPLSLHVVEAS